MCRQSADAGGGEGIQGDRTLSGQTSSNYRYVPDAVATESNWKTALGAVDASRVRPEDRGERHESVLASVCQCLRVRESSIALGREGERLVSTSFRARK